LHVDNKMCPQLLQKCRCSRINKPIVVIYTNIFTILTLDGLDIVCCARAVDVPTERPSTEAPADKCSSDEFTCGDGTCIPLSQRCDWTEYHCADGTDEFDCRMLYDFFFK